MISNKSVSICNRSHAGLVDSSRNRAFWTEYPNLMPSNGRLFTFWTYGSKRTLLKSTVNAENFTCRLSWSISSDFGAVYSWNEFCSLKSRKIAKKSLFWGFKVVQGHRCWYPRKARQQCLFTISSKYVSICIPSHARRANSGKITIS